MREIGAFEAKNRLGALLDLAENGEEIVITRRGKPVAKLGPVATGLRSGKGSTCRRGPAEGKPRRHSSSEDQGSDQRRTLVSFVLDNSVALTWCFEDERTPATKALLERVGEAGATAPALWPLEALNGLLVAERRRRLNFGATAAAGRLFARPADHARW